MTENQNPKIKPLKYRVFDLSKSQFYHWLWCPITRPTLFCFKKSL